MEIKEQDATMGIDSFGHEYVAETETVYTMEGPDGTEYEAEIITTAHADDPTVVDSHMFITQTDSDGNEIVTEYITQQDGTYRVEDDGEHLTKVSDVGSTHHIPQVEPIHYQSQGHTNILEASDGTTASDYLYTGTGPDIHPVETSVTADDHVYNAEYNANYAHYEQDQANIAHDTAIDYANHGDYDAANVYMESYDHHQEAADDWSTADID
ncbi:MAG TPA: hypothetical protein PKY82_33390 [Pyrinomonadaceae bacterium]|nr:hypothetical protein [Pyrinomonadaceae bacterium]